MSEDAEQNKVPSTFTAAFVIGPEKENYICMLFDPLVLIIKVQFLSIIITTQWTLKYFEFTYYGYVNSLRIELNN